ncbi:hypothetical protein [Sedimentitalea xiamensis]|uniref:hypothetical protein n=1 Tax=Sedimentitalea xiamensis TaxID=3050037 RepID=UPI00254215F5|nr:hypothetical protein [Sedimentitalea xiamensis]
MRFLKIGLLMTSLSACASTQGSDAVQDATVNLRKGHASALLTDDIGRMRGTGEKLLTALACGWGEKVCQD